MPFVDENGNTVQLSPQDQAAYWQQSQGGQPGALVDDSGKPVDPFSLPASDIASLVKQAPDKFDLISQFAARPDLQKDPATVAKVADAFHQIREQPIDWKDIAKHAPGNVWNVISGLARYGVKVTSGTLKQLGSLGIAATPQEGSEEAAALAQQESRQELGEAAASAEQGMTGLVSGAVSAAKALGRGIGVAKPLKDYDQTDKVNALFDALSKTQQAQQIAAGQGPLAQAVTGGVVPVRPEEVVKLTSPFDWEALGAGTKAAGAVLPSAAPLLAKAGEIATTAGGKAVTVAAQGGKLLAKGAEKLSAPVGGVAGALTGGHIVPVPIVGHVIGALEGATRGSEFAGKFIGPATQKLAQAADFGKQISGDAPLTSAYAQLARSALQSAPTAAAELGKGVAFDISQVAGADTPQERESAVGLGTAFGLLGAANASGRHVISGQLIAPRDYAVGIPVKSSGSFPDLDALHDSAFANLTDGQKARINATRLFLSKAAPGTDVFVTGDNADATSAALQASGMSKSQADFYAQQRGFATRLNGRKIIGVQEPGSAPHEAFHGIEDVIGAAKMRELDDAVKQQYAGNWNDFGRYYTSRLTGQDTGPDWRAPLLDASGWGNAEAVEKLYREAALKYSQEAQANGQPPPTEEQVKEAVKAQGPIDWRSVLTPEEQQAASDRYIAREKLAENFDAAFKHSGPALEPGQQMPEKVARTLGQMMQFFGANPIAGARSEGLGVPLSPSIISKVGEAARGTLPDISAAPILAGKERIEPTAPVAGPTPPTTADTARRLAQEQPDVPLPGQNQSQREIAGAAAEAFANDSALHLQYSSAPDEPAASLGLGLKRQDRRSMIEAFRQMPDAARQLFGKLFFPKKFIKTKASGIQIQGWSPEVFAANAHRWSKFIGELAQKDPQRAQSLAKYEVGPHGLTEKGWRDLYADLQNFVANQRAGRTGAGEGLVVPRKVTEAGYFAPPTVGEAGGALPQDKADLINMLFGFRLPGTEGKATRAGGAAGVRLPQNIAGRLISEATQPGRVSEPVEPRGAFGGGAAEKQGVAGEPVMEVNPYRKALEQAAKDSGVNAPSMIESWQNLNLNRIKEAELAPEQPKFGANPLTLQAGFLPKEGVGPFKANASSMDLLDKIHGAGFSRFFPDNPDAWNIFYKPERPGQMWQMQRGDILFGNNDRKWHFVPMSTEETQQQLGGLRGEGSQFQPKREVQLEGPDGKKYRATFDGYQDMSVLGRGMVPQFTALEDLPGGPIKGSTTYKPSWEKAGYKVPTDLEAAAAAQLQPKRLPKPATEKDYSDRELPFYAWQSPDGKFYKVPTFGHEAWAQARGTTSDQLFKEGWNRVLGYRGKADPTEDTYRGIYVDADKPMTKAQRDALEDLGFSRKQAIVKGDNSKVLIESTKDFAPEYYGTPNHLPTQYQPKTFVVRHGSTEMNNADPDKDLIRGHINVPLDAKGRKEAEDTAKQIASQGGVQHIITSDLDRTVDTAKAIQDANPGSTITEDAGLRPWNFGPTIEGHPTTEMLPKIAELTENPDQRPPGGETFNEFKDRFLDAFHRAQDTTQDANAAIVTHYRGTKLIDAWRKAGVDNDTIDKAAFEEYDKSKKPGNVDVIDKRGEVIEKGGKEQPAQFQAAKRRSRDDYKLPEGGPGLFQKAWIMPDGKPVQLGDKMHHDWLNDNPAIKKQYGIKGSDEDNRVEALQKGFARVNYEKNTGTLTVEARATDWPKLRDSVKKFASVNLGKIDNMDVSLLDPKAKKTVAADGVQLHSYPTVEEKMEQLPFIGTGTGGVTELSPQASSLGGQYLPSTEPRALRSAAIRDPETGQIFEAPFHAMAVQHALGLPGYKNVTPEALASFEHGFTTNEGEFLDRAQSAARAAEMNQLQQGVGAAQMERKGGIGIEHLKNEVLTQMNENRKAVPSLQLMQASPKETIAAFKDEKLLPEALHNARYAIITANRESVGPASNPINQQANENLEKALIADGYQPQPVKGEYKGVDQGKSFLVPDMTPEDAIRYAKNYGQESVLGPEGLIYQNGEVNPAVPSDSVVGAEAKKRDGWSQVEGGPAFSMGLDFDKRVPLAQFAPQADLFGAPVTEEKRAGLSAVEKGKLTKEGLAQQYPEAVVPKKRDQAIPSDIVGSPLYKKAFKEGGEKAAVNAFADRLESFAKEYQDRPAFKDGAAWYDHIAPAIKKAFGKTGQLFAEFLAATSPGQKPDLNFRDALQAHDRAVAGDYDKKVEKYVQGLDMAEDEKKWRAWLGKHGTNLPANPTPETFLGQWIDFHDLKLTKLNGKLFGHNSVPVLNVAARRWLADAGPKTSNFVKNLLGLEHEATIDLWADRTMRWAGYEGSKERWRILPENNSGVDDKDFAFAQKVFAETAKRLGMRPDQLQGALWFAEKQRWADNGWSPLNLGTYEPEFSRIPEHRAKVAQEEQLQALGSKIKPLTGEQSQLMVVQPRKIL